MICSHISAFSTWVNAASLQGRPFQDRKGASELGAAYRNRTDDLRITRGPAWRVGDAACTDAIGAVLP